MPKSAKRRNDRSPAPIEASTALTTMTSDLSDRDIARCAFELYCEGGREDGHDVDDWLNAERELRDSRPFSPQRKAVE